MHSAYVNISFKYGNTKHFVLFYNIGNILIIKLAL